MDKYAIEELGISGTILMERAGEAAFAILQSRWPNAKSIAVVCGTGNNGGDGYVIARLAKEKGIAVKCLQVGDSSKLSGDALAAAQRLFASDVDEVPFEARALQDADVLIDAILGTGLQQDVRNEQSDAITQMNQSGKPILALDIPSGLNADNGRVQGAAIKASATVTFIGNKMGLYMGEGPDFSGERFFDPLSVPLTLFNETHCEVEIMSYDSLKYMLSPRASDSHKGLFGHVLVVGGELGYSGAARMAGEAAGRIGAGLVSIATRPQHADSLNSQRPELMVHGIADEQRFISLAEKANVIAIGPGLGQSDWAKNLLRLAIDSGLPLVVDADALNLLAAKPEKRDNWILTPHVGEAARMLGMSTQEIQADRIVAINRLQQEFGGVVVLKGNGTLVSTGQAPLFICTEGNPGMASGGMGDVLSGIIAGLLAQRLELYDAARLGVCLHASAGDQAAKATGQRGMLACDLMPWVRRLANPQ